MTARATAGPPDIAGVIGPRKVIPVVTIARADDAAALARALLAGGIDIMEITLRTPAALDAASAVVAAAPEMIVGIGTVLTEHQLAGAKAAGARFAVSPGFTPDLAEAARRRALPWLPGGTTGAEIMQLHALGHAMLKFFPAEPMGGRATLRAFAGPFPTVRFCPTGGVGDHNCADYLALANVLCVGGAWIAPEDEIAAGDWDAIQGRAAALTRRLREDRTARA